MPFWPREKWGITSTQYDGTSIPLAGSLLETFSVGWGLFSHHQYQLQGWWLCTVSAPCESLGCGLSCNWESLLNVCCVCLLPSRDWLKTRNEAWILEVSSLDAKLRQINSPWTLSFICRLRGRFGWQWPLLRFLGNYQLLFRFMYFLLWFWFLCNGTITVHWFLSLIWNGRRHWLWGWCGPQSRRLYHWGWEVVLSVWTQHLVAPGHLVFW